MSATVVSPYATDHTPAIRSGFREKLLADIPIVFVIHEDAPVREWLRKLMDSQGWRPEICAAAEGLLASERAAVPNCLVLDGSLSERNSFDLQKHLASERPEMPIIFIADQVDVPTTVKAMKAGAVEFFTKPYQENLVLNSVREALEGSRLAIAKGAEMRTLRESYALLTTRERQVMALVVSGLLNKQVGSELGISEITVKAHRGQVMQKMNAGSLADLVKKSEKLRLAA